MTLIWMFHQSFQVALPIPPNSHLPNKNRADSVAGKFKVDPTQVRGVMARPVFV